MIDSPGVRRRTLFPDLRLNQQAGSKPRCHLLTEGPRDKAAANLTEMARGFAVVEANRHDWMPCGFGKGDRDEAELPKASKLLDEATRRELGSWWLTVNPGSGRTPNWDIASTCTIDGCSRVGLLLIEAKAHKQELVKEETGRKNIDAADGAAGRRNLLRIDWALRDASVALADETGLPWALSRDWCYQMSNRFAWAWKLTSLGIPVVLVYLGFLEADEMGEDKSDDRNGPLSSADDWEALVLRHSQSLFPREVWNRPLPTKGAPLIPLIRSKKVPLIASSAGT